jgi:hypothetical protein
LEFDDVTEITHLCDQSLKGPKFSFQDSEDMQRVLEVATKGQGFGPKRGAGSGGIFPAFAGMLIVVTD